MLGVPLLREGTPVGVLLLQRSIVQPFTNTEIALAETFADQAVIAIENVRLFDAVQKRTQELSEALEQQTATSEVLKVISRSPGELEPVFNAMLENARGCARPSSAICSFTMEKHFAPRRCIDPPAYAEARAGRVFRDHLRTFVLAASPETKQVSPYCRPQGGPSYTERDPAVAAFVDIAGARTILIVPMLKENELVGVIVIYRQEVRPFTDKQIELVTNFAAQAVIAIENTRLLNELRSAPTISASRWSSRPRPPRC